MFGFDVTSGSERAAMAELSKADGSAALREMIAFVCGQEYCVDVMSVREIRGLTPVIPIPHAPSYVRGMINLRGTVLPIIDLAERLGFQTVEPTACHAFLVVEIDDQLVGLLVEGVSDILTIDQNRIQPSPDAATAAVQCFVSGIVATEGHMISLIALNALLPTGTRQAA
jgi:purine-binding chemotaxis protein CheW